MKQQSKIISQFMLVILVLCFIYSDDTTVLGSQSLVVESTECQSYTPHDPIIISNESEMSSFGFPGLGTQNNPFRIEGLEIITEGYAAIRILGVSSFFIIMNCNLEADSYCIDLQNIAQGRANISGNICKKGSISVMNSPGSVIEGNMISDTSHHAILVRDYSHESIVEDNICHYDKGAGILFWDSEFCTVSNNYCYNTRSILLRDNIGYDGIYFSYSDGATVSNNHIFNDGLRINVYDVDDYLSFTVIGNKVNGKKLGFFKNRVDLKIDKAEYGQIILVNCMNSEIIFQEITNTSYALELFSCENCIIRNSTFRLNTKTGIKIRESQNTTISNCLIYFTRGDGIYAADCDIGVIDNSYFIANNGSGIQFSYTNNFTVTNSLFQQNSHRGLSLFSSSYNSIHHNSFFNNSLETTINAYDYRRFDWSATNNTWFDEDKNEGNYWDNWIGTGEYPIEGNFESFDSYPLEHPLIPKLEEVIYPWEGEGDIFATFNYLIEEPETSPTNQIHYLMMVPAIIILLLLNRRKQYTKK